MGITTLPSGKFRLQIRRQGFPRTDETFLTRTEAETAMAAATQRLRPAFRDGMNLNEIWEMYAESYDFAQKAKNTKTTERCRIQPVLEKLGQYSLKNLAENTNVIYDYIDARTRVISKRTKKKLSPTSVRLEIAALSALVAFAKKRRLTQSNFIRHIDRPATKKRKRRVPPPEQGKLQLAAHAHGAVTAEPARFVLLLRLMGCRPGELAELRRADVDLRRHEALFRDTKNGTDRLAHITKDAIGLIQAQIQSTDKSSPFVFSSRTRKTKEWRPYNYSYAVKLLKEVGIVGHDFHAHASRREYISRAIEAGIPLATIRKQTGHKSTQALEIYDEGLSTAPEIRTVLEKHAATVKSEQLSGALEALGLKGDDLEQVVAMIEGRKPQTDWVSFSDGK